MPDAPLTLAIPKGRVLEQLVPLLEAAGVDTHALTKRGRALVRHAGDLRFLMLKPDDVPTYVEFGVADLGVVGTDVLLEREYDLFTPLDLELGRCELAVAQMANAELPKDRPLRVATKYPNVAARHFSSQGRRVELVFVQGSVELAPLTGLSDVIVDIVETGETLRQNGLVVVESVAPVSSVVVANRVGLKLQQFAIAPLIRRLSEAVQARADT